MGKYTNMLFDIDYLRIAIFTKDVLSNDNIDISSFKRITKEEKIIEVNSQGGNSSNNDKSYIFDFENGKVLEYKTINKMIEIKLRYSNVNYISYEKILLELDEMFRIVSDYISGFKESVYRVAVGMQIITEINGIEDASDKINIFIPNVTISNDEEIDNFEVKVSKRINLDEFDKIKLNKTIHCALAKNLLVNNDFNHDDSIVDIFVLKYDYNTENNRRNEIDDLLGVLKEIKHNFV